MDVKWLNKKFKNTMFLTGLLRTSSCSGDGGPVVFEPDELVETAAVM